MADFTKVEGKSININETNAKQLLANYNCKANVGTKEIKNYLAAVFQRMILEIIFNNADNLYKFSNNATSYSDSYLEAYIVYFNQIYW